MRFRGSVCRGLRHIGTTSRERIGTACTTTTTTTTGTVLRPITSPASEGVRGVRTGLTSSGTEDGMNRIVKDAKERRPLTIYQVETAF